MSINDCSSEVSLRSAAVARTFEKVPPVANGCEALINDTQSPPTADVTCALFRTFAALTCFVFAIDLARALVYLPASLSYRLS